MQYGGDSVLFKKRLKIYFAPNDLESGGIHESPHEYIDPRQTYHVERIVDDIGGKEQKYYELIGFRDREGKIIPRYRDDHEPIMLYLPINDETKDGIIFDATTELMKKYGSRVTKFHRKTKSEPMAKKSFIINDMFQHALKPDYEVRPEMVTRDIYDYMTRIQSLFYPGDIWRNNVNGYKVIKTMMDYAGIKLDRNIKFLDCKIQFIPKTLDVLITDEDNELNKMILELESLMSSITDRTHPDVITFEHATGWIRDNIFVNHHKYCDIITRTLYPGTAIHSGLANKIDTKYVYYNLSIETHIPEEVCKLYKLYQIYTKIFDDTVPIEYQRVTDDIRPDFIYEGIQSHAGLIIVNNEHNTIYRFEPHGGIPTYYSFFTNFEQTINRVLTSWYVDYTVLHPMRTCPARGTQRKFDLYDGACFFHTFYFECLLIFNPDALTHEPGRIDFKYIHRYLSDNYTAKFINFYFTLYHLLSLDSNQYYSDQIYETVPLQKRLIEIRIVNSILANGTFKTFRFYPFYDTLVNLMIELIKSDTSYHEHSDLYEFTVFKLAELNRHDEKNELTSFIASIGYAKIIDFDPFKFLHMNSIICSNNTYVNIIVPTIIRSRDALTKKQFYRSIDPHTIIKLHRDNLLREFEKNNIPWMDDILSSYHFALLCDYDFYEKYENYVFYDKREKNEYIVLAIKYNSERGTDDYEIINMDECIVQTELGDQKKITELGLLRKKPSRRYPSVSGDDEILQTTLEDVYNQFMDYKDSAHNLWNTLKTGKPVEIKPFNLYDIKMFYHDIIPECIVKYTNRVGTDYFRTLHDSCIRQFYTLFEYITSNLVIIDEIIKQLLFYCTDVICEYYRSNYQVIPSNTNYRIYSSYIENLLTAIKQFIESPDVKIGEKRQMVTFLEKINRVITMSPFSENIGTILHSDAVTLLSERTVPAVGGHMHTYNKFIKYNTKIKLLAKKIDHAINNMPD